MTYTYFILPDPYRPSDKKLHKYYAIELSIALPFYLYIEKDSSPLVFWINSFFTVHHRTASRLYRRTKKGVQISIIPALNLSGSSPIVSHCVPTIRSMELYEGGCDLKLLETLEGHGDRVWSLAWNPATGTSGTPLVFASCSGDKTVRIWEHTPSCSATWTCKASSICSLSSTFGG